MSYSSTQRARSPDHLPSTTLDVRNPVVQRSRNQLNNIRGVVIYGFSIWSRDVIADILVNLGYEKGADDTLNVMNGYLNEFFTCKALINVLTNKESLRILCSVRLSTIRLFASDCRESSFC